MAHPPVAGWLRKANTMKLKIDANGAAVLVDGKPVYVHDDGKEVPFDAPGTVATISRLNAEAKTHRERAETAEKSLLLFKDIKDPAAAILALQTVQDLGHKKLVDIGEVEKVRNEVAKVYEGRLAEATSALDGLKDRFFEQVVGGAFSRSKAITDKFVIPADLVQARFGQHFGIEDDRIYATDVSGNRIFSRARPGELADFDEALMTLVDQYPYKDQILKGAGGAGSGAGNGSGAGSGGKRTITRAAFDALGVNEKASAAKEMAIVD